MAKVAIMGYGTVGSGVYEILKQNAKSLKAHANGEDVSVKYILDIRDFPDHPESGLFTKQFDDILNDSEVTVVSEVMGGLHPAYEFTKALLEAGKSVVTSNKELVATYGTELLHIAEKNNVNYFFEASVGGGIPIIRPIHQCLTANNIKCITGILNGTTNYVLNEMITKNRTFAEALADAQEKGYAERNPAADIEGHDACRKIAILASLARGKFVDYKEIATEGITNISLEDIQYAKTLDSVIKLIGYAEFKGDKVFSIVSPMLIKNSSPLAGVDGVFNAIMVTGDYVGDVMFYGRGAGKLPTASAVVADIIDAVKHNERPKKIEWDIPDENIMLTGEDKAFRYLIRTTDSKEKVKEVYGNVEFTENLFEGENAFITEELYQQEADSKKAELSNVLSAVKVLG